MISLYEKSLSPADWRAASPAVLTRSDHTQRLCYKLIGERREKSVCAHQALFWPRGNGATVTPKSDSQGWKTRRTNR